MPDGLTTEAAAEALGMTPRKLLNLCERYGFPLPDTFFGKERVWSPEVLASIQEMRERVKRGVCAKCGGSLTDPEG